MSVCAFYEWSFPIFGFDQSTERNPPSENAMPVRIFPIVHAHNHTPHPLLSRIDIDGLTAAYRAGEEEPEDRERKRRKRDTLAQIKIELPQSTVVRINRFL